MSSADLTIINADQKDIPIIQQLTYAIWPQTYKDILTREQADYMLHMMYSAEALTKQMNEGHQFIFVQEANRFIAFASYAYYKPSIYKLHKIYALTDQQGKGIGKFIINYISGEIKPLGATALQLNVNRYNKAKGFYERLGFTVISEEDIDIGNGYLMNDYVMELIL